MQGLHLNCEGIIYHTVCSKRERQKIVEGIRGRTWSRDNCGEVGMRLRIGWTKNEMFPVGFLVQVVEKNNLRTVKP